MLFQEMVDCVETVPKGHKHLSKNIQKEKKDWQEHII